ncbi:cytochrome P450 [Podospora australis]|uniref:Cytochrome P450 n=1 Tax=Podospora australis TaxID=1536484 RepID=A0AAN6WQH2_9PEZI|nr:cytochrome P450 [Podospora australis]
MNNGSSSRLTSVTMPAFAYPTGPYGLGALAILFVPIVTWALSAVRKRKPKSANLPVYHVVMGTNAAKVLEQGHKECPDTPFVLSQFGLDAVILPTSEIETVKSLPESELSIKHHHYNVFLGEYSYMGTKADEFDATMRHLLVRNTPVVLDSFTAEVEHAVETNIGGQLSEKGWTPIRVRDAMSRVASLMSGRAFVGLPLCRDPEWVEATTRYTQDVSIAYIYLRALNPIIKPFVAPFSAQVKSLLRHREINVEKLAPLLEAKKDEAWKNFEVKAHDPPGGEMLDWFISRYMQSGKPPTVHQIVRDQLLATFASIYNLSNALTYVVFDLAAYPEHVEELRQELRDVLGSERTAITKSTLPKLKKLDSFVRESQRMSPPSIANIPRYVASSKGFTASTGHHIPKGHTVMVRAEPINRDPALWGDDVDKFDGFRFSKLRDLPGNEMKYQHTSTGTDNINFGHGIWACPGRFFASAEIKVVLAYLVANYELKLVPGEERPGHFHYGFAILPDTEGKIMFKRRE